LIADRTAFEPGAELQRAAELLIKYWLLAIPTAVASVAFVVIIIATVIGVIASVFVGHATGGHAGAGIAIGSGILLALGMCFVGSAVLYIAQGMVMAAAPAVLEDRQPDLGAALSATLRRLPDLLLAGIASLGLAIIPLLLCIVLIGFPLLLILGYFLMYVPAAVVVGGEGGIAAIGTSFRLTTRYVGESLIGWLGLMLAMVAGSVANSIAIHIPGLNLVAAFVIGGFTSAYSALVSVRFYLALRDRPVQPSPPPLLGGPPTVIS